MFTNLISYILTPLFMINCMMRKKKGLEDSSRYQERFGIASKKRPADAKLIWIHAASVGEAISVIPLLKLYKKYTCLLTTGTKSSADIIEKRFNKDFQNCIHQYIPYDQPTWVAKLLDYWKPSIGVFIESEIWPVLTHETEIRKIPLILINARLSDKTVNRWKMAPFIFKALISRFSVILAQSEKDADSFRYFWKNGPIKNIGNLKYAAEPLEANTTVLNKLKKAINGRNVFLAASTHEGEEELILEAYSKIKNENLLLIIVPRHINRVAEILKKIPENLVAHKHSCETLNELTNVYLVDTFGELGTFYRLADIAFVGGSLIPRGGHNIAEPAKLGCAIIHGNYMSNFTEMRDRFKKATIEVSNVNELTCAVKSLLEDKNKMETFKKSAEDIAKKSENVLNEIEKYLNRYFITNEVS